jgi:hypothetical protein
MRFALCVKFYLWKEGGFMPRRERDRELARRRKRSKERRRLKAKGLLRPPVGSVKENEKKKPEKKPAKETPKEMPKEVVEKPSTES